MLFINMIEMCGYFIFPSHLWQCNEVQSLQTNAKYNLLAAIRRQSIFAYYKIKAILYCFLFYR